MHLIKTTPFAKAIKHSKRNLHQLAKAIRSWVYLKKKLNRATANSSMMEFHEQPPWNRFTFPEPESDDNRKSWYKGDEKEFMSCGSLPSDPHTDSDQESWYEGDEKFFDIEDMPPLKIRFTEFDELYQEVLREHEADRHD